MKFTDGKDWRDSVSYVRSKRARRVSITISPVRGVRVSVPRGVPYEMARQVVTEKAGWIMRHLARFGELKNFHLSLIEGPMRCTRKEARGRLAARLHDLSLLHGIPYNRVFVRDQKTLWGSCSGRNNISLNAKLVLLPQELVDYVILHELVHTRIRNHGAGFWRAIERLVKDARVLDRRLRDYNPALIHELMSERMG